jgi:hypothetical protein
LLHRRLIDRAGSVEWLCWPRLDWPSTFARLLDRRPGTGRSHRSPTPPSARRYLDRTMVLETTFTTSTGIIVMTDALVTGIGRGGPRARQPLARTLVAACVGDERDGGARRRSAPRPEYGLVTPVAVPLPAAIRFRGGPDVLMLSSPVALVFGDGRAFGRFDGGGRPDGLFRPSPPPE